MIENVRAELNVKYCKPHVLPRAVDPNVVSHDSATLIQITKWVLLSLQSIDLSSKHLVHCLDP